MPNKSKAGVLLREMKAKTTKSRRTWSHEEVEAVLHYLVAVRKSGKALEKPNAGAFYETILGKVSLDDCSVSQVKHQVGNLKKKYQQTMDWRNQTGQGVLEEDGQACLMEMILKRCPHFELLQEIYGEKLTINPPYTLDSMTPEVPSIIQETQGNNDFEELEWPEVPDITPNPTPVSVEKNLLVSQKGTKRKNMSVGAPTGSNALSELANMRMEMHLEELAFNREKWTQEGTRIDRAHEIEKEKFNFSKALQQQQFEFEIQKQKDSIELEKYRIDQEMKLKLEIAKLQHSTSC